MVTAGVFTTPCLGSKLPWTPQSIGQILTVHYAVSFVAQQGSRVRSCSLCSEPDQRGGMLTAAGSSFAKTEGSQLPGVRDCELSGARGIGRVY